jgi:NAD(P)-dependent dehydrogenase (short-subunit alcohol dehydrogenase family)
VEADVSKPADVARLFGEVDRAGGLDTLVNNGLAGRRPRART